MKEIVSWRRSGHTMNAVYHFNIILRTQKRHPSKCGLAKCNPKKIFFHATVRPQSNKNTPSGEDQSPPPPPKEPLKTLRSTKKALKRGKSGGGDDTPPPPHVHAHTNKQQSPQNHPPKTLTPSHQEKQQPVQRFYRAYKTKALTKRKTLWPGTTT